MQYLDETLRFRVKETYPNKVIDYYSLSLEEIHSLLKIQPVNKERAINAQFTIVDSWFDVKSELDYLNSINDYHRIISILGYEIVDDHYIKIFYQQTISPS
ncbi:hypothetical protein NSQ59_27475 [Margalitia sp. FSL K6-0131]|uniref:hypothetical protein n=1 Tax=Margalitia sp. FSL K6-0131 TaxID=2954604 RepID=UPI0030F5E649